MTRKRIKYGDIFQLLEAEGFASTRELPETELSGRHVRMDHVGSGAAVILPKTKGSQAASTLDVDLVRHTLVDFGIMSEAEFDRWVSDPKHFQAA